jgi:hypothetical protein
MDRRQLELAVLMGIFNFDVGKSSREKASF